MDSRVFDYLDMIINDYGFEESEALKILANYTHSTSLLLNDYEANLFLEFEMYINEYFGCDFKLFKKGFEHDIYEKTEIMDYISKNRLDITEFSKLSNMTFEIKDSINMIINVQWLNDDSVVVKVYENEERIFNSLLFVLKYHIKDSMIDFVASCSAFKYAEENYKYKDNIDLSDYKDYKDYSMDKIIRFVTDSVLFANEKMKKN